jgi:hypothetical protein
MDIGKSFTYAFDDEKWVQKLAIGGLLTLVSIIPIVNIFTGLVLVGYGLRVLNNVAKGKELPLPEWDDWGGDWVKGLMIVLGGLIYSIPIWIVSGVSALLQAVANSGEAAQVASVCVVALSCLSSLWSLAIAVVLPAGIITYGRSGEFASFFRFGELFRFIGDNLANYIVALLLMLVAALVSGLGVILCVIGVFFTQFWSSLVTSHLFGQVAAEAGVAGRGVVAISTSAPEATYGELEEAALGEESSGESKDEG